MFSGIDSDSGGFIPSHIRVDIPFSRGKATSDLYFPQHRLYPTKGRILPTTRSETRKDDPVIHKDIITVWKGLSVSQAHELKFWDQALQACVENLIGESLVYGFSRSHDTGKFSTVRKVDSSAPGHSV